MLDKQRLIPGLEAKRRQLILGLFIALTVFTVAEIFRGRELWIKLNGSGGIWDYTLSLMYYTSGMLALLNAMLLQYHDKKLYLKNHSASSAPWVLVGIAFIFFAYDKDLQLHVKLGERMEIIAPWLKHIYFVNADSLFAVVYIVGAIFVAGTVLRGSITSRAAKSYFVAGLVMAAGFAFCEYLGEYLYKFLNNVEQLLEAYAGWAFIASFVSVVTSTLTTMLPVVDSASEMLVSEETPTLAN